jgi:putative pyrroloquinoline-quinone binding quinoprotein
VSTTKSHRSLRAIGPVVLGLAIAACSAGGGDADAPFISSGTDPTDADAPATTTVAAPVVESDFYCGTFGAEQAPTLLAIDLATGEPVWRMCSASTFPLFVWGRAVGATILLEQDGRLGGSIVAVDDTGVERWRRPTRMEGNSFFVSGSTAVAVAAEVEGIEAATGEVLWQHPVADGTPLGATEDFVIEVSGGPYALSSEATSGLPSGRASMRAVDAVTGEQRWARPIDLVPLPPPNQYSPTVGDTVIAIANTDGSTEIIDATTGDDLRTEPGFVVAEGSLLIERDATTYRTTALVEPVSGSRLEAPSGTLVYTLPVGTRVPSAAGRLVASDPPTGPAATLRLVDTSTGAVRWQIPYLLVIGRSSDHIFVVDGPLLQVLDATDGSVAAEYRAPTDLVTFKHGVAGDGIVVVSSEWRGSPGPSTPGGPVAAPDCTNGPTILEAALDDGPLIVTESPDGQFFCIEMGGTSTIGNVPTVPTADPQVDSTGMFGSIGFYTLALPEGFAQQVTVVDEGGVEMTVARGSTSDYLVLIQPRIGQAAGGPATSQRTVDLLGPGGDVLAKVTFTGFPSEDVATFEDFMSCASDHGVEMTVPPVGGAIVALEPSPPDVLRDAWESCRDLYLSSLRSSQQAGPEFLSNQRVLNDCLADAGYYQTLGQPIADGAAFEVAYQGCQESTPGRVALIECLRVNGLEVVVDGVVTGGPHPPELAAAAWNGCRSVFVTWEVPSPLIADNILGRLDCAAGLGWITQVMDRDERANERLNADLGRCAAAAG